MITRDNKLAFKIKECLHSYLKHIPCTEPSPGHDALKTFSEQFYTWGIHYLILFEQDGLKGFLPKKKKKCVLCGSEEYHHVVSPRASTFFGVWIDVLICVNRVQPSNKLLFPNKTTNSLREVFFPINFLFETENGVKLRSRYLFFLVVIRLMAFMFVVMDSEGDFFSRRQSTSLTCIPWTAWSCKNYEQGDRKLSLFLENYFSFFVHLSVGCLFHVLVISEIFLGGWVGGWVTECWCVRCDVWFTTHSSHVFVPTCIYDIQ